MLIQIRLNLAPWRNLFFSLFKDIKVFCNVATIFPWKKVWPFLLTNLISITKGCSVLSLVENSQVVLEKRFFKVSNVFPQCHYYLLFDEGMGFHLVEIGTVVLEKKTKNEKLLQQQ